MSIIFIFILITFGITLVILEIFLVPGLIVGIAGGLFMMMGILWTWQIYGQTIGMIVGFSSIALCLATVYIALKTGFWKKFSLNTQLDGKMNVIEAGSVNVGDTGNAISSLRPMGTVRVNGIKFEASTEGQMIPPNFPIIVSSVESGKIIVRPIVTE
ncbi:hypothetical protein BH11BAC2_BH11BAC2_12780 [soil metagenome]